MRSRSHSSRPLRALFVGGVLLALAPLAAAQTAGPPTQPQQPQQPQLSQQLQPPQPPEQPSEQPPAQEPPSEQAAATTGATAGFGTPNLEGDQFGLPGQLFVPRPALLERGVVKAAVPVSRSFKITEDENPRPLDRAYVNFNYYNDVNGSVNDALHSPIHSIEAYRETFGLEKTFLDGDVSVGVRLPLNTLSSRSDVDGLGGTTTSVGDLTVILKGMVWEDRETGDLLSAGLAVTAPTGPSTFANSNVFTPVHDTLLTPFLGFILKGDRAYIQGFSSIDVPTGRDVVLLHNDVQFGYFLLRNQDEDACLTAVVPLFEVHVNDPLNHRGATNIDDPLGTPDFVDLTGGVTFELKGRTTLAVGVVTPVTGPKPFDFEVLAQLNVRFGPNRGAAGRTPPPGPLGE